MFGTGTGKYTLLRTSDISAALAVMHNSISTY